MEVHRKLMTQEKLAEAPATDLSIEDLSSEEWFQTRKFKYQNYANIIKTY